MKCLVAASLPDLTADHECLPDSSGGRFLFWLFRPEAILAKHGPALGLVGAGKAGPRPSHETTEMTWPDQHNGASILNVPAAGTYSCIECSLEADHPQGDTNEEDFLRFGGSGRDRSGSPGSRSRQADGEGGIGQAHDARPHASPHARPSPLSSPHDEEADDG
jgi:hypothetical protein